MVEERGKRLKVNYCQISHQRCFSIIKADALETIAMPGEALQLALQ